MFKAVRKVTVTEQIMEQIAELITSGQLKPGEQLPTERDLAVRLGVTRGRVREALRALSLVGLIQIKAGEGSFVSSQEMPIPSETIVWLFHNELHNIEEVYAARELIESRVYLAAAEKTGPAVIEQLRVHIGEMRALKEKAEPAAFLGVLDAFDLFLGEHCGNAIYGKLIQTMIHLRRETSLKLLAVPGARENSIRARTAYLRALESGGAGEVARSVDALFKSAREFYDKLHK